MGIYKKIAIVACSNEFSLQDSYRGVTFFLEPNQIALYANRNNGSLVAQLDQNVCNSPLCSLKPLSD